VETDSADIIQWTWTVGANQRWQFNVVDPV